MYLVCVHALNDFTLWRDLWELLHLHLTLVVPGLFMGVKHVWITINGPEKAMIAMHLHQWFLNWICVIGNNH